MRARARAHLSRMAALFFMEGEDAKMESRSGGTSVNRRRRCVDLSRGSKIEPNDGRRWSFILPPRVTTDDYLPSAPSSRVPRQRGMKIQKTASTGMFISRAQWTARVVYSIFSRRSSYDGLKLHRGEQLGAIMKRSIRRHFNIQESDL